MQQVPPTTDTLERLERRIDQLESELATITATIAILERVANQQAAQ
jgi:hypothetical protein